MARKYFSSTVEGVIRDIVHDEIRATLQGGTFPKRVRVLSGHVSDQAIDAEFAKLVAADALAAMRGVIAVSRELVEGYQKHPTSEEYWGLIAALENKLSNLDSQFNE